MKKESRAQARVRYCRATRTRSTCSTLRVVLVGYSVLVQVQAVLKKYLYKLYPFIKNKKMRFRRGSRRRFFSILRTSIPIAPGERFSKSTPAAPSQPPERASEMVGFFSHPVASWDGDESHYECEWDATVAWLSHRGNNNDHDDNRPSTINNFGGHSHQPDGVHHRQQPSLANETLAGRTNIPPPLAANAPSSPRLTGGLTEEQRVRIAMKREEALAKKRRLQQGERTRLIYFYFFRTPDKKKLDASASSRANRHAQRRPP